MNNLSNLYSELKSVILNPANHTAQNAFEHCQQVRARVKELCQENGIAKEDVDFLDFIAKYHDIGKVTGSSNPKASLELLRTHGISDEETLDFIKYHDINLSWYISFTKGERPSVRAWNKMSRKVDMRLMLIFMIADRIDAPNGWKGNDPLVWFIQEVKDRGYLSGLTIDGELIKFKK